MDEKKQNPADVPPPEAQSDAEQFSRWMAEYGRPALIGLAVAVVVLLGLSIWRSQKREKAEAAAQALFQGRAPEEFRQMAAADPKAPTAPMALATAAAEFYAQGRYDEALSAYQSFLAQYPGHMLEADARLGVAASLEALDDFEAAAESYESFAAALPDSSLVPQAVMGAARCREQLGQFDEARVLYEDFIAANPDSSWLPQAESGLLFLKKAERAKDLPPPAAPAAAPDVTAPEVVFDSSLEALQTDEPAAAVEAAAETVAEPAVEPARDETGEEPAKARKPRKSGKQADAAEEPAVDETAAADEVVPAVEEESKPKKRKSSKKSRKAPAEEPAALDAPAAE